MHPFVAKFNVVLPSVKKWIEETLEAHAKSATLVLNSPFTRLQEYLPKDLLSRSWVVVVPRVPFPPLSQFGLSEFKAMEGMLLDGVTYKDTFFVRDGQQRESLYFHELVHVVQWECLGVENFLLAYGVGLLLYGYQRSPLEQMACQLQGAFEQRTVSFNLMEQIRQQTDFVWSAAQSYLSTT